MSFLICLISSILLIFLLVYFSGLAEDHPEPDRRPLSPRQEQEPQPEASLVPEPIAYPYPNAPVADEGLQSILDGFVAEHPGEWDIYIFNLSRGNYAAVNTVNGNPMISASLIKLYIMGAVLDQVQAGKLQYWDVYGSIQYMIVLSDNYSANYLIYRLGEGDLEAGFDCVNAFALSNGCEKTSIQRTMLDTDSGLENYTGAEDCAQFLKKLYRCLLVSPEYSKLMMDFLKDQRVNDRIPAGLPEGTVCAHKTGDLSNISCGDCGIVFSPNADYILSVINNHSENDPETIEAIASLSAQIYEYFNPPVEGTEIPEEEYVSEP